MDEIEKRLYHDLKPELELPTKYKNIIREGVSPMKRHYSILKIATTTCATLTLAVGIVYAGTTLSNKIWKEPEKIVGYVNQNTITKEDLKSSMSEEEAKIKAKKILENFGYTDEKIKSAKLERNGNTIVWNFETNNKVSLSFDSKGGEWLSLFSSNVLFKDIKKYHTTKEEAEKIARDLCQKYKYDLSDYTHVKVDFNMASEEESYIWYVNFYKEHDTLVDEYNKISIAFIPEINELYYFTVQNEGYENNSIEITEEQAKEVALIEEQKTNIKYKIKDTKVELGIVSMNGDAYARTIDYEQYCKERKINYSDEKAIEYRTNKRIRKAWKVSIEYNIPVEDIFTTKSFNISDMGYTYYIDTTTGEIIGGEEYTTNVKAKYENGKLINIES